MKNIIISIFAVSAFYSIWFVDNYPKALRYIDEVYSYIGDNFVAAIIHRPVTVADLQDKYDAPRKKVRILLVPGHEPVYGGAEYRDLKERDMNVELSEHLAGFLKSDKNLEVILTRDKINWNPLLVDYFNKNWTDIISFVKESKAETLYLVNTGKITAPITTVLHNKTREDVGLRLFGINKWSNENNIDIALHIHFNDYPRRNASLPGKYSGFSIYVPARQYLNSTTTKVLADDVFKRLEKYNAVSDFAAESVGVIEDGELIALGVHNTNNAPSMLIEYSYIYEPQFEKEEIRKEVIKDLAFQTYLGIKDFFGETSTVRAYDTLMLPYVWQNELAKAKGDPKDIIALQSALLLDGLYPGEGKTKNDCPRTGVIGLCTLGAIGEFQKRYGIKNEEGRVGEKTRQTLNERYSAIRL